MLGWDHRSSVWPSTHLQRARSGYRPGSICGQINKPARRTKYLQAQRGSTIRAGAHRWSLPGVIIHMLYSYGCRPRPVLPSQGAPGSVAGRIWTGNFVSVVLVHCLGKKYRCKRRVFDPFTQKQGTHLLSCIRGNWYRCRRIILRPS